MPILVLQNKEQEKDPYPFKVRHEVVKEALLYLKENNPAYENIVISDENLEVYKSFQDQEKPVDGVRTQVFDDEQFQLIDQEVLHEADAYLEKDMNGDLPRTSTSVPEIATSKPNVDLIKEAIEMAGINDKDLVFNKPQKSSAPVSEFCDNYYSMAFPHLFHNGVAEYNRVSFTFFGIKIGL